MEKIDLKKQLKHLYRPVANTISCVDVPPFTYLMVDGVGNPNTAECYKDAVEALFSVSYALKFMLKKGEQGIDYAVMPLEGLWWVDEGTPLYASDGTPIYRENKDNWKWTVMIMQPEYITEEMFQQARESVSKKKPFASLAEMRFECLHEGPSAQILHIGSFENEHSTIKKLEDFLDAQGYAYRGKHHEIYLNDFNRTAPEKLQTIIRQPYSS